MPLEQREFSSIFALGKMFNLSGAAQNFQVTLDCPGRTYMVGVRARF
jgi:hypothetical protein